MAINDREETKLISIRFRKDVLEEVKRRAASRGVGYQTLLQEYVAERLKELGWEEGVEEVTLVSPPLPSVVPSVPVEPILEVPVSAPVEPVQEPVGPKTGAPNEVKGEWDFLNEMDF